MTPLAHHAPRAQSPRAGRHAGGPVVVKLGGRALAEDGVRELAADLLTLGRPAVIVHGGGAEVSDWCDRLAIPPRFHEGLRVTDGPTLDVVAAVLAGLANKRLVATLRAAGVDAVGIAALDGGIAALAPHPEAARLGQVGEVRAIHPELLLELVRAGRVPVLSSLGALDGRLLNVNADDLAAALAIALGTGPLVLVSDTPGLVLDGARVARLDGRGLERALAHPDVKGGMRPKLRAARDAIARGVPAVHLVAWSGPGTLHAVCAGESIGTHVLGRAGSEAPRG